MAIFTPSQLLETQLKVDDIWQDSQLNAFYKPEVEGLRAIIENSAATLAPLQTADKNNTVSVNWVVTTGLAITEGVVDNCVLNEPTVASAKKNYALDMFPKAGFSLTEQQLKDTILSKEEVVAKSMLEELRLLDEALATRSMAKADAYAGSNLFLPANGGYSESLGKTQIPAGTTAVKFFAYLNQAMIVNRMRNSFLIENGTMYQEQLIAGYNAGNLDGKGTLSAFSSMKIYNDLFNMTAAGLTSDALLINRSALAFVTRSRFNKVPEYIAGNVNQTHYSIASPSLIGVRYDVIYTMTCAPGTVVNDTDIKHQWRIMANAGLFLNPTRTAGNTGVLAIDRL